MLVRTYVQRKLPATVNTQDSYLQQKKELMSISFYTWAVLQLSWCSVNDRHLLWLDSIQPHVVESASSDNHSL
jgi:hypothetical protein